MIKGLEITGVIEKVDFPNRGVCRVSLPGYEDSFRFLVKGALKGQTVRFRISRLFPKKARGEGLLLSVEKRAPEETEKGCPLAVICGGCAYQTYPYIEQLKIKENAVRTLMNAVIIEPYEFLPILGSPVTEGYRNKMEYTFGDEVKGGPLALGLHRRGSFYDIVTTEDCFLVHSDINQIMTTVLTLARETGLKHYHKVLHEGYFRFLIVRRASKTGEILINLVTADAPSAPSSSQNQADNKFSEPQFLNHLTQTLCSLKLQGTIVGVLHTRDNGLADAVEKEETILLYGRDYFYEELLGLTFRVSPFSFFQTNSLGAEVLYRSVREFVGETRDRLVFDLYSGTGTIAQMLAPVAKKVIGVEIVAEAVEAAKQNALRNSLSNCSFITGDVFSVLDTIEEKPDIIVLDPPRDGVNPRALKKILAYQVDRIVYVSCKPTSLQNDLVLFQENGYRVEKLLPVDMFPGTEHVETIVALHRTNS